MDWRQEEALWRYSLIRELADARLSWAERGALVRALAVRLHALSRVKIFETRETTTASTR